MHDLSLVLLAAALCVMSTGAAVAGLWHARSLDGRARRLWLAATALVTGVGVWSTHFVAMLAYEPGLATGYDVGLTLTSLAIGIMGAWAGGLIWIYRPRTLTNLIAGAGLIGGGMVLLHYIGMAALIVSARAQWAPDLVIASGVINIAMVAAAGRVVLGAGASRSAHGARCVAALLLTLGVVGLHFVGMGALTLTPDPTAPGPGAYAQKDWLAGIVTLGAVFVIAIGVTSAFAYRRIRSTERTMSARIQQLADAGFEGLMHHDGETIGTANKRVAELIGRSIDDIAGVALKDLFAAPIEAELDAHLSGAASGVYETLLRGADGLYPVEIQTRMFTANQTGFVTAIRDLRARKQAEAQLHFLSNDEATGLPRRAVFEQQLDETLNAPTTRDKRMAVLMIEARNLEDIAEHLGPERTALVLTALAERVREHVAGAHLLGKAGAAQFSALLIEPPHATDLDEYADRVHRALGAPIRCGETQTTLEIAIGVSFYPNDAIAAAPLLLHAETALKQAEDDEPIAYFQPLVNEERRRRRTLTAELRQAVENGEIAVHYQPQALVATGCITGFEALARWIRADGQQVSPASFIALAEEANLIQPLGEHVLRTAARQAAAWPPGLQMGVNASALQMRRGDFAIQVERVLHDVDLPARALEIEITESALIDDAQAKRALRDLRDIGVKLALDDFGAGYSSLAYLRELPFDRLKIDRSFLAGADCNADMQAILRAILTLGRALRMETLAEGVETEAEYALLRREGCDMAQGYLIASTHPP